MDLYLLQGNNTIFFVGLAMMSTIKSQVMECWSIDQMQSKILKGTKNISFTNVSQILKKSHKYKTNIISPYEIIKFRKYY